MIIQTVMHIVHFIDESVKLCLLQIVQTWVFKRE